MIDAAKRSGYWIAAAGTHPFANRGGGDVTPNESYLGLEREYQRLAREKVICGCHVHVGIPDLEAAVQTLNRVRPWLSAILALAVNSPFWSEEDTGMPASARRFGAVGPRPALLELSPLVTTMSRSLTSC